MMRQEPGETDEELLRYIRRQYKWRIPFIATGGLLIALGVLYSSITLMRVPSADLRHACLAVFFVTLGYVIIKMTLVYRKLFQILTRVPDNEGGAKLALKTPKASNEEGIECIRQLATRSRIFRRIGIGCIMLGPLLGGCIYWFTRNPDAGLIMAVWLVMMGGGLTEHVKQSSKIYPLIKKRCASVG